MKEEYSRINRMGWFYSDNMKNESNIEPKSSNEPPTIQNKIELPTAQPESSSGSIFGSIYNYFKPTTLSGPIDKAVSNSQQRPYMGQVYKQLPGDLAELLFEENYKASDSEYITRKKARKIAEENKEKLTYEERTKLEEYIAARNATKSLNLLCSRPWKAYFDCVRGSTPKTDSYCRDKRFIATSCNNINAGALKKLGIQYADSIERYNEILKACHYAYVESFGDQGENQDSTVARFNFDYLIVEENKRIWGVNDERDDLT